MFSHFWAYVYKIQHLISNVLKRALCEDPIVVITLTVLLKYIDNLMLSIGHPKSVYILNMYGFGYARVEAQIRCFWRAEMYVYLG